MNRQLQSNPVKASRPRATALAALLLLGGIPCAHAAAPTGPCGLVTAAEFTTIVGGKPDGAPVAGGSTCSLTFDRWQRTAQVQVVEGWGEGDSYQDLVKFWREENARSRKRGAKVAETTVKDAFCESAERPFMSPQTRCMRQLPGERVLYAMVAATSGSPPPPVATVMKLLDTATPRAR